MRELGSVHGVMEQVHPTDLQRREAGQGKIPTGDDGR